MRLRLLLRLSLVFSMALTASLVSHADVRPFPAEIKAKVVRPGMIAVESCELGECVSLGSSSGYTKDQWEEIQGICQKHASYASAARHLVGALTLAAAAYTGAVSLMALLPFTGENRESHTAVGAAATLMPGTLKHDQHFQFSINDFVALRNGMKFCTGIFDQNLRTQAVLNRCANPLLCSLEGNATVY